ncbi:hypothetical protein HDU76_007611 [Blyttiomyces sp. JEL0837]|nr:hypothetical protein HDU76_007611 [Blyttiomyces sp. JEL0837]
MRSLTFLIFLAVKSALASPVNLTVTAATTLPGSWQLVNFSLSPTSGAVLPDGNILIWAASNPGFFTGSVDKSTDYEIIDQNGNPVGPSGQVQVMDIQQMFCTGTTNLPDGSILMNGGSNNQAVTRFDWTTNTFSVQSPMNLQHGYNADVLTTADTVLTIGGSWSSTYGGRNGEIFTYNQSQKSGSWTLKNNLQGDAIGGTLVSGKSVGSPDPQGIYRSDNHAWLVSYEDSTNGHAMVAHLGPVTMMHVLDTTVTDGATVEKGLRGNDPYAINAAVAHFAPGKILKAGGAVAYGDSTKSVGLAALNIAVVMDITALSSGVNGQIKVTTAPNLNYARTFTSGVVLPGGRVFVVGGQSNIHIFEDTNGIYTAEIYDPVANTFTPVSPNMAKARNYHSLALLLPSAKVLVAGGGLCSNGGGCQNSANVHYDGELFTPYYLLNGRPRPSITSADANLVIKSTTKNVINVVTQGCAGKCTFEMIRMSSSTHTVNNDQIRVPLNIVTPVTYEKFVLGVFDADKPFITSGYYMLFAISRFGVPSVAATVHVSRT